MDIRKGTIEEAIKIDMFIDEFEKDHIQKKIEKFKDNTLLVLIASENGRDIGYSISYDEFKDGSLYACYAGVIRDYRNKGVYTQLANERENIAKSLGYTSIKLYTRNMRREILAWLIKNNWNIIGLIKKSEVKDNRILFEKIIN